MTTLCVINNHDETAFFRVPTNKIPRAVKRFQSQSINASMVYWDDRILLHKYFGIGLDDDIMDDDDDHLLKERTKVKASVPIFEQYKLTETFAVDPDEKVLVICMESST
jgi:hypothetical protein